MGGRVDRCVSPAVSDRDEAEPSNPLVAAEGSGQPDEAHSLSRGSSARTGTRWSARAAQAVSAAAALGVVLFVAHGPGAGVVQLRGQEGVAQADPVAQQDVMSLYESDTLMPRSWEDARAKAAETEGQMTDEERLRLIAGSGFLTHGSWVGVTGSVDRLGVPALKMQDASAGFRPTGGNEYGTVTSWPSMLTQASTWDVSMVSRVAAAIGAEFKGKGANVILGPGVNVHRTAYGGRNFEYLSGEDPHLGAKLADAYVRAVQGQGVMSVVKHFAFNEQETMRGTMNSMVSDRVAWELYYPPFEAALAAGAGAVMCSYNRVNGSHACENDNLLNRDLKERMGFSGFVMSDWDATHSTEAIEKGLDMEQPSAKYFQGSALAAVNADAVKQAARRVLASIYHMRLDEHPGCALPCDGERSSNQRTAAHLELAEQAATEGIVLLKNDDLLPLSPKLVRKLAILGAAAALKDTMNTWGAGSPYSGGGSGHVASPNVVTPVEGISDRARAAGMEVVVPTDLSDFKLALKAAEDAEVVIVVGATTSTEDSDRHSLALDHDADRLITAVAQIRPTVVLLETPGAVLTPWREDAKAIACIFAGGEKTGNAWANILFGDAAPAGRLPIVFPATAQDTIHPGVNDVPYHEEMLTSYRSPTKRVAFPFGHGLTYTHFEYGAPWQPWPGTNGCSEVLCVGVLVTNRGSRPGREVAQAYVQFAPYTLEPRLVLRSFHKTRMLVPGESERVLFSFSARDLSTYDVERSSWKQHEWVVMHIGASSGDIRRLLPVRTSPSKPVPV